MPTSGGTTSTPDSDSEYVLQMANDLSHIDSATALDVVNGEASPRRAIDRLRTAEEYLCPSQALAAMMNAAGNDAWMYYFSRIREDEGGAKVRAYHGAEYPYVFATHDPFMRTTATDLELTRIMQAYWTSFAANGDPNNAGTLEWPRFKAPGYPVKELGDQVRTVAAPEPGLCRSFLQPADIASP